ncbi:hypothetical protein [Paenibacillus sp. B2(2019)]|uniref:hypothetical protein n=1 Tax=Paenibacillus sp. B2(2019) TaxID=2607754 RepID=UPI001CB7420D|nr:hypothetical protein [Paenibacillus sp. B2(2019)]
MSSIEEMTQEDSDYITGQIIMVDGRSMLTIKRFPLEEISFSSSNLFIVRLMAFGFRVIIKKHAI